MEQKQLDEIDESYFGEEFIEEDLGKGAASKKDKKTAKKATKKSVKTQTAPDEITITPVKQEPEPIKATAPVDPWADMDEEKSGSGTWKTLTGLLVILLIASIFTNGFDFSGSPTGAAAVDANGLNIEQAEAKALNFVNTNLLQPPFTATVESSSDEGSLYKVILSVAGQTVDSYLTKDGNLFFPQGFDTTEALPAEDPTDLAPVEPTEPVVEEPIVEPTPTEPVVEEPVVEPTPTEPVVEEPVIEEPVAPAQVKIISLKAKKWSFTPDYLTVAKGTTVQFIVTPETENAAFSLPEFTFSVLGLGVEEAVSGQTTVEFVANEAGEFDFTCSSCEAWRGMTGTLVVE
jgi:plastocyanin